MKVNLKVGKRKHFDDLKSSKIKKARVDDIIKVIKADDGFENGVVEKLKMVEKDSGDAREKEEAFKMCCLNLMKTLSLSETK